MLLSGQQKEQCQVWYLEVDFKACASHRLLWGCDTSVSGSKACIVTGETRARPQA